MPEKPKHRSLHEDVKKAEAALRSIDPYHANRVGELRRSHSTMELTARSLHADATNLRARLTALAQAEEIDSLRAEVNAARHLLATKEGSSMVNAMAHRALFNRAAAVLDLIAAADPQGKV